MALPDDLCDERAGREILLSSKFSLSLASCTSVRDLSPSTSSWLSSADVNRIVESFSGLLRFTTDEEAAYFLGLLRPLDATFPYAPSRESCLLECTSMTES